MPVQIQEVIQRLPIVVLSHKLSVGKKDLGHAKRGSSTVGQTVRERQWTDVPAGEECAIHLDLTQRCLARKRVSSCTIRKYHVLAYCPFVLGKTSHYCSYTPWPSSLSHIHNYNQEYSCTLGITIKGLNFFLNVQRYFYLSHHAYVYFMQDNSRAYAPRFPKTKDEGWWLVLGEVDSGELLALKRIGRIRGRTQSSLAFPAPDEPSRKILTLYLMSDCYLGLDQQFDLSLNFVITGTNENWCFPYIIHVK